MVCGGRGKEDRSGQRGEDPVGVAFGGMAGSVFFLSWRAAVLVDGDEGNNWEAGRRRAVRGRRERAVAEGEAGDGEGE